MILGEICGTTEVETVTTGRHACYFSSNPLFFAINYAWALCRRGAYLVSAGPACVKHKEQGRARRSCVSVSNIRGRRTLAGRQHAPASSRPFIESPLAVHGRHGSIGDFRQEQRVTSEEGKERLAIWS